MSTVVAKTLTPFCRRIAAVDHHTPLISSQLSSSAHVVVGDGSLASASSPSSQEKGRRVWSKLLLFVPGVNFGLGTWQIFRRQDKVEMLDYRQRRLDLEPIKLTSASSPASLDDLEFRRIVCRDLLDETGSIFGV
ncbi:hypothetical protein Droror1_Dr00024960 [Drosera rotundifolia]